MKVRWNQQRQAAATQAANPALSMLCCSTNNTDNQGFKFERKDEGQHKCAIQKGWSTLHRSSEGDYSHAVQGKKGCARCAIRNRSAEVCHLQLAATDINSEGGKGQSRLGEFPAARMQCCHSPLSSSTMNEVECRILDSHGWVSCWCWPTSCCCAAPQHRGSLGAQLCRVQKLQKCA